jgi:hypothetical protein
MDAVEQGLPEPVQSEVEGTPAMVEENEFDGTEVWEADGMWWTGFPRPRISTASRTATMAASITAAA